MRKQLIYPPKSALCGIFILNVNVDRKCELFKAIQPFLEAFTTRSSLQDLLLVQNIRLGGHAGRWKRSIKRPHQCSKGLGTFYKLKNTSCWRLTWLINYCVILAIKPYFKKIYCIWFLAATGCKSTRLKGWASQVTILPSSVRYHNYIHVCGPKRCSYSNFTNNNQLLTTSKFHCGAKEGAGWKGQIYLWGFEWV